ncbi:hypothetical protein LEP1GSC171_1052 [Leptospira santarosai str. HAI1380]|uniref:Uncharacterized protein n=3 Tax=Leptospira santarosai TaxID=28183 RepID=M6V1F0_9LEPT|nr:hypothetical protein LEP1GSC179_1240 [Leptospira santarosai str. MOR084]EKO76795.1 hypothetical protein LEP1GSC068_0437 [Leptospira sp. Fiocruz LV3954]EKS06695.1 hypothetical protein LEP1GSC071_1370 [Leptospira santarosai str. JET]EMI69605.1 hypothetical protein LEP1GSC076_0242 [Leptospira sp. Fiocruz LV4135]EMJ51502.1 hypothetical protein LEP1GSC169_1954 [Leptospira santarosai str. HAI1349]EMM78862.1 hypothetical protein LEP1GSC040_2344 [Leptospira santarosai str. 2000030832]EMM85124.1 hy
MYARHLVNFTKKIGVKEFFSKRTFMKFFPLSKKEKSM